MGRAKSICKAGALVALSVALDGCRPTAPTETDGPPQAQPAASASASLPAIAESSLAVPILPVADIVQSYAAETDLDEKAGLIALLAEVENAEAVTALGRLLANERDQNLKIELLAAAIGMEPDGPEKLAVFESGLWPSQPQAVRLMAIDGLAVLATPEAAQKLEGLRLDADGEVRAAAAEALAALAE